MRAVKCWRCEGTGTFAGEGPCFTCKGTGLIDEQRRLWLTNVYFKDASEKYKATSGAQGMSQRNVDWQLGELNRSFAVNPPQQNQNAAVPQQIANPTGAELLLRQILMEPGKLNKEDPRWAELIGLIRA